MKKRITARISADLKGAAGHILCLLPGMISGRMSSDAEAAVPTGAWVSNGVECHAISGDWDETGNPDPAEMGALDFIKLPSAVAYAFAKDERGGYVNLPKRLLDAGWGDTEQALCQKAEDATVVCEADPETGEYDIPDAAPGQIVICLAEARAGLSLLGMAPVAEEDVLDVS